MSDVSVVETVNSLMRREVAVDAGGRRTAQAAMPTGLEEAAALVRREVTGCGLAFRTFVSEVPDLTGIYYLLSDVLATFRSRIPAVSRCSGPAQ